MFLNNSDYFKRIFEFLLYFYRIMRTAVIVLSYVFFPVKVFVRMNTDDANPVLAKSIE